MSSSRFSAAACSLLYKRGRVFGRSFGSLLFGDLYLTLLRDHLVAQQEEALLLVVELIAELVGLVLVVRLHRQVCELLLRLRFEIVGQRLRELVLFFLRDDRVVDVVEQLLADARRREAGLREPVHPLLLGIEIAHRLSEAAHRGCGRLDLRDHRDHCRGHGDDQADLHRRPRRCAEYLALRDRFFHEAGQLYAERIAECAHGFLALACLLLHPSEDDVALLPDLLEAAFNVAEAGDGA
jgi:hypothetical protein